jgi:hypothetical protein
MSKQIHIKCSGIENRGTILAILFHMGYSYNSFSCGKLDTVGAVDKNIKADYPNVLVDVSAPEDLNFCSDAWIRDNSYTDSYRWPESAAKILKIITSAKTMTLTDDYEAIVTHTGITVGCQDITWEKFDELTELVKQVRK